jgi:hypothetical protein
MMKIILLSRVYFWIYKTGMLGQNGETIHQLSEEEQNFIDVNRASNEI